MPRPVKDITGMRSHFLTAVACIGSNGKKALWLVRCDCGKELILPSNEFLRQKSCGCQSKALIGAANKTHGFSKHPAYWVWRSMRDRCRLPTHHAWADYGGRGIRVCPEWDASFEAFWRDMGPTYRRGLSLDRINVNGNYCPENCRWVTVKIQNRNRRSNRMIDTPWGPMTMSEAAERSAIGKTTLLYRLDHGVPVEHLFDAPDVTNRFTTSSTPGRAVAS